MITKTEILTSDLFYPEDLLVPREQVLFFDIETTGFISAKSDLYLIGSAFFRDGCWHFMQWLAENPEEELLLLKTFQDFSSSFSNLVHFNGDTFDLPFLRRKAKKYQLEPYLESLKSIDLLRMLRSVKKFLGLSQMNQTSLEAFLGISRKDAYTGKDLISVYEDYGKAQTDSLARLLLLHNHDDVIGMLNLLPLLSYLALWRGDFQAEYCELDQEDTSSFSLVFHLLLPYPLPRPLSRKLKDGYFYAQGSHAKFLVHGLKGILKHFFQNYQDYYYLPFEDMAIHRSVGIYVDREHRIPAKASTCYCTKAGSFIPDLKVDPASAFRTEYSSSEHFREVTPAFMHSNAALKDYAYNFMHLSF